ncbi:VOC family protein [Phenylobacterium sp. LjRoot219]|uniref:VOC family protein n=1 Tax=Phenylobacterium sp. LjRoot219 TaxID=3342283 RepID=UPI003ED08931
MSSVFGDVRQIGLMSRDIDRSMRYFVEAWGMGPWFVLRNMKASMLYKGQPRELEVSIAMANCGDLQFEIVEQHNDAPSLYQDALKQTPELHVQHVAVWTEDVDGVEKAAHAKGWSSVFEPLSGPGRSVFVIHPSEPKVCIEISDRDPFKERVREAIKQIAADWDGSSPIREGLPQL